MPDSHLDRIAAVGDALRRALAANVIPHSEISHAAALASVVSRGGTLSVRQARTAHRVLSRSNLAAAGIELPPEPEQQAPVAGAHAVRQDMPVLRVLSDGKIGATAPFAFKDTFKNLGGKPSKEGATWVWRFAATPTNAANLLAALEGSRAQVSDRVAKLAAEHHRKGDLIALLDETAPLPEFATAGLVKPEFSLWDHQRRSVEFGSHASASLHAIPMGGGKTLATIATVNRTEGKRVVIVCPNKVRGVWPREVRKFSAQGWHIVSGMRPSKRARSGYVSLSLAERLHEAEACLFDCTCGAPVHAAVINYEALAHEPWANWRPPARIDVAVYDEIHKAKAHSGTISKNLAKWVDFTGKRIGLTGTPMPQTPLDVFGIFRALDPGIFGMSWTLFRSRYAITGPLGDYHIVGVKNIEDLAEKFFSITYRPTIDLKLPAVTDITREFDLEPKARRAYDAIDKELWADLSGFTGAADMSGLAELDAELDRIGMDLDPELWASLNGPGEGHPEGSTTTVTPANVMVRLLRLQQLTGGSVTDDDGKKIRVSTGKADLLAEVLDEVGCVASEDPDKTPEPVIVFCRFRSDLDAVADIAANAGLRYAEVSGRRSDGLTQDSEMTPDADVVGVQIQSGGTGVDLTRARVAVWYSLGYSLSDYDQARKRLDRPGQTRPVIMVHLLAADTADMEVYEGLESRRSVIAVVMAAHGIDASAVGFREQHDTAERWVNGKGEVALPFDRLIMNERARVGSPVPR
jgi:SNF2 family DNA or RNA helicase